jgi:hypothetical protein
MKGQLQPPGAPPPARLAWTASKPLRIPLRRVSTAGLVAAIAGGVLVAALFVGVFAATRATPSTFFPVLVPFLIFPLILAGQGSVVEVTGDGAVLRHPGWVERRSPRAFLWQAVRTGLLRFDGRRAWLTVELDDARHVTWPLATGKALDLLVERLPDWCPAIKVERDRK